jgi:hypothetical protein
MKDKVQVEKRKYGRTSKINTHNNYLYNTCLYNTCNTSNQTSMHTVTNITIISKVLSSLSCTIIIIF